MERGLNWIVSAPRVTEIAVIVVSGRRWQGGKREKGPEHRAVSPGGAVSWRVTVGGSCSQMLPREHPRSGQLVTGGCKPCGESPGRAVECHGSIYRFQGAVQIASESLCQGPDPGGSAL